MSRSDVDRLILEFEKEHSVNIEIKSAPDVEDMYVVHMRRPKGNSFTRTFCTVLSYNDIRFDTQIYLEYTYKLLLKEELKELNGG